eukprot:CAMPEP_0118934900 /NCGR_PEP_ID=MMETSP1169-20130426/14463_1 /TAXON_ID=36882 /ORGANISM="Pyramimonas obovata, Strain CCMP722" /LENGTH=176 /DNA_ID=CAMNT_0006877861 /DNA_START=155 /DNA_END=686 /DNA_ORIENTATION=+
MSNQHYHIPPSGLVGLFIRQCASTSASGKDESASSLGVVVDEIEFVCSDDRVNADVEAAVVECVETCMISEATSALTSLARQLSAKHVDPMSEFGRAASARMCYISLPWIHNSESLIISPGEIDAHSTGSWSFLVALCVAIGFPLRMRTDTAQEDQAQLNKRPNPDTEEIQMVDSL